MALKCETSFAEKVRDLGDFEEMNRGIRENIPERVTSGCCTVGMRSS
jgi:hypothetical protein